MAERVNSYAFYSVDVWIKNTATLVVAIVSFVVLAVLAWRNGRTYCNTICPVGTVLGFLARFSLFRPVIDQSKCNGCTLCARNCKAACIDTKTHVIDYSRCVVCMDCIGKCHRGAISYALCHSMKKRKQTTAEIEADGISRRGFLAIAALFSTTSLVRAQEKRWMADWLLLLQRRFRTGRHRLYRPVHRGFVIWQLIARVVSFAFRYVPIRYCVRRVNRER